MSQFSSPSSSSSSAPGQSSLGQSSIGQSKIARDVFGGIISVMVSHLGLAIIWAIGAYFVLTKLPFFRDAQINAAALMIPIGILGACQLIYILPLYYYFNTKGRRNVCIGIVCSAVVTLLMGLALGQNWGGVMFLAGMASIAIAMGLMGVIFVRMRMQPH
jgi:hypothetical protein